MDWVFEEGDGFECLFWEGLDNGTRRDQVRNEDQWLFEEGPARVLEGTVHMGVAEAAM